MLEDFVMNTVNNVANFNGQRPVIDSRRRSTEQLDSVLA